MFFRKPTNNKDWATDQAVLAYAEINGNEVSIFNIRDFSYKSEFEYTGKFLNLQYSLNEIQNVDIAIIPFTNIPLVAHCLLCFNFTEKAPLVFSIEVRKTKTQQRNFSASSSLFNNFELMYLIATEDDALKLRTNLRTDEPAHFLYRLKISQQNAQLLFLDLLKKANDLSTKPEFFNLAYNSCSSNLFAHLNKFIPHKVPLFYRYLAPGLLSKYFYKHGIVEYPQGISYHEFLNSHNITPRARAAGQDYSQQIRSHLPK